MDNLGVRKKVLMVDVGQLYSRAWRGGESPGVFGPDLVWNQDVVSEGRSGMGQSYGIGIEMRQCYVVGIGKVLVHDACRG